MSIQDTFSFDKDGEVVRLSWVKRFFVSLVIILVGLLSFGIGRLSGEEAQRGSTVGEVQVSQSAPTPAASAASGSIVASANGTKYYYPGCSNNISDKNKIFFATSAEAEAAGYTLALNCQKP